MGRGRFSPKSVLQGGNLPLCRGRALGSNPRSTPLKQCDFGEVTYPLWTSVSSFLKQQGDGRITLPALHDSWELTPGWAVTSVSEKYLNLLPSLDFLCPPSQAEASKGRIAKRQKGKEKKLAQETQPIHKLELDAAFLSPTLYLPVSKSDANWNIGFNF